MTHNEITGAIPMKNGNIITPGIRGNDIDNGITGHISNEKTVWRITHRERAVRTLCERSTGFISQEN